MTQMYGGPEVHTYTPFFICGSFRSSTALLQFNYASAVHRAVYFAVRFCSSLLQFASAVRFCSSLLQFSSAVQLSLDPRPSFRFYNG